jgi:hypothetical protein
MLKAPVSSKLTRLPQLAKTHAVWEWDNVRHVHLKDGTEVMRHSLLIQPTHTGILTLSMGPIARHDVGRRLVVDVGLHNTIDIIQDADKPF